MLTIDGLDLKHYFTEDSQPHPQLILWLQSIRCPTCLAIGQWRLCGRSRRYFQEDQQPGRYVWLQRVYCRSCCRQTPKRRVASRTHVVLPSDMWPRQWLSITAQKRIYDALGSGTSKRELARHYGVSRFMIARIWFRMTRLCLLIQMLLSVNDDPAEDFKPFSEWISRLYERLGTVLWHGQKPPSGSVLIPP